MHIVYQITIFEGTQYNYFPTHLSSVKKGDSVKGKHKLMNIIL